MRRSTLTLTFILSLAPGLAQDVHFSKNRYSSIIHTNETDVDLSITDSEISIKSKQVSKSVTTIHIEIPYSSIEAMSFEQVTLRATEPALGIGGLFALIEKAFKSKSYWLEIEYRDGDAKQSTVLRLDESEYQYVIAALEAKTGKHIAILDPKTRPLNPTAESKFPTTGSRDMDEVVPFSTDQVIAALKPAMESQGCRVREVTATRIECKRARGRSEWTALPVGGETVTGTLEARDEQTRIRISTGKGWVGPGREGKKSSEMMARITFRENATIASDPCSLFERSCSLSITLSRAKRSCPTSRNW